MIFFKQDTALHVVCLQAFWIKPKFYLEVINNDQITGSVKILKKVNLSGNHLPCCCPYHSGWLCIIFVDYLV